MKIRIFAGIMTVICMIILSCGCTGTGTVTDNVSGTVTSAAAGTVTDTAANTTTEGAANVKDSTVIENTDGRVLRCVTDSAAFSPRKLHKVFVFNNKMWLFGGRNAESDMNDIWQTSDGRNWEQVKPKVELPSFDGPKQIVVFKNKIWIFAPKGEVWNSSDGVDWTKIDSHGNYPERYGISPIVFNDRIWFIGGWNDDKKCHDNDVWYSGDGIEWEVATDAANFSIRSDYNVTVYDNKLWIIAGQGGPNNNDAWYSEDGKEWIQATPAAGFQKRHCAAAAVCYDRIWLIGGFAGYYMSNCYRNDVWSSADGAGWTEQDSTLNRFSKRNEFQAVEFDNKLWVIGGETGYFHSGELLNDVWCLE